MDDTTPVKSPRSAREKEIEGQKFWGHYLAVKNATNLLLCRNASGTITIAADRRGAVQLVSVLMRCGAY